MNYSIIKDINEAGTLPLCFFHKKNNVLEEWIISLSSLTSKAIGKISAVEPSFIVTIHKIMFYRWTVVVFLKCFFFLPHLPSLILDWTHWNEVESNHLNSWFLVPRFLSLLLLHVYVVSWVEATCFLHSHLPFTHWLSLTLGFFLIDGLRQIGDSFFFNYNALSNVHVSVGYSEL